MVSTFQSVVLSILFGVTHLFPLAGPAQSHLVPWFFGWSEFPLAYQGVLELCMAMVLLVIYRHEWAGFIGSFLQIVIYRRKPMTMDERLPFFLMLAALPLLISERWIAESFGIWGANEFQVMGYRAVISTALGWMLALSLRWSRRKWSLFDWNAWSALGLGVVLTLTPITGMDMITLGLMMGFFLNHRQESALKFVYLTAFPYFLVHGLRLVGETSLWDAGGEMSRLSYCVGILAVIGSSWIAVTALNKQVETQPGFKRFAFYRTLILLAFLGAYWLKTRG